MSNISSVTGLPSASRSACLDSNSKAVQHRHSLGVVRPHRRPQTPRTHYSHRVKEIIKKSSRVAVAFVAAQLVLSFVAVIRSSLKHSKTRSHKNLSSTSRPHKSAMIIDKQSLPDDPTPLDAPPSYDTLLSAGPSVPVTQDRKYNYAEQINPSTTPSPPGTPPPLPPKSPPVPASVNKKGKARATNWFPFSLEARTAREVRNTVLGLVRDLIQEYITNSAAATGILQSCSEACSTHSLSFSSILQERSIEDHTPLYWAIVKRPPDEHQETEDLQCPDLLTALISYATPLKPESITEVRLACLATSDQTLFQRLRLSPEFAPVSGANQMLLGGTIPPDEIELEDIPGEGGGSFAVNFVIPHFHKRMVVTKQIALEFIARSRMWRLAFFIAPEPRHAADPRVGSWCISLSLVETSPPTHVQARIIIPEATSNSTDSKPLSESPRDPPPTSPFMSPFRLPSSIGIPSSAYSPKPSTPISLVLKSSQPIEAARRGSAGKTIVVSLEESNMGANLQYGNNPYIGPDEKLRARLEARLGKSEGAECIIC